MTADTPSFVGVVLCGGESRRMGQDKALLPIDGVAMARRVADALLEAGATEVLALGGDADALGALGLVVHPDEEPGGGPLPATMQALRGAGDAIVLVASCDLLAPSPTAMAATVAALVAAPEVLLAVPVHDGHRQWTHAAWRAGALAPLEAARAGGAGSLRRAAADLPMAEVHDLDPAALADADTPSDLPGR